MRCENCGGYSAKSDRYCKRCGGELRNARLPVRRSPMQPTLWNRAAPVLARGAALVALGVVAEVAVNALAKGVFRGPSPAPANGKRLLSRRRRDATEGILAVSETIVMRRTVVRR